MSSDLQILLDIHETYEIYSTFCTKTKTYGSTMGSTGVIQSHMSKSVDVHKYLVPEIFLILTIEVSKFQRSLKVQQQKSSQCPCSWLLVILINY